MHINLVKGELMGETLELFGEISPLLVELDKKLEAREQWGLFYTHRLDENASGDNLLVYPANISGDRVIAVLLDLVMDLCDRNAINPKDNRVLGGLVFCLNALYNGKTTDEIKAFLGNLEKNNVQNR